MFCCSKIQIRMSIPNDMTCIQITNKNYVTAQLSAKCNPIGCFFCNELTTSKLFLNIPCIFEMCWKLFKSCLEFFRFQLRTMELRINNSEVLMKALCITGFLFITVNKKFYHRKNINAEIGSLLPIYERSTKHCGLKYNKADLKSI